MLICPHLVDEFTLSLDAIKAHEYLATDRPVVATTVQRLRRTGRRRPHRHRTRDGFAAAVHAAVGTGPFRRSPAPDWDDQAVAFSAVLDGAR